jgi:beta-lactamase regulating signal transducer with metallopeptidase domain
MNPIRSLFESVLGAASFGLEQAILAGCWAGLLAVPVLLVNVTCRRWISAGQMGLLWALVLLRLLLPAAPGSPVSLQFLVWSSEVSSTQPPRADSSATVIDVVGATEMPSDGPYSARDSAIAAAHKKGWLASLLERLPLIWLAGAIGGFCWTITAHWQFCRRVRKHPICQDARLLHLWRACCRQARVRRNVPIVVLDFIRQPAVMGTIYPKLLLPADATSFTDEQLQLVMLHELAHVRRCDVALNWLLAIVRAIHWWNPVCWLATARFGSLREQACDAFAIRHAGQPARVYRELLLTFAEHAHAEDGWRVTLPASILGFFGLPSARRGLRNRLDALRLAGWKQNRWQATAVVGGIAILAACGLTDAKPAEDASDSCQWLPKATIDRRTWTMATASRDATVVACTYDVAKVLDHLVAEGDSQTQAVEKLGQLVENILRTSRTLREDGAAPTPSINGASLVVRAPLEAQAELQRCLEIWQASGLGQICVECRFLTGFPDPAAKMGVSWQYLDTSQPDDAGPLSPAQATQTPMVRATTALDDYSLVGVATLSDRQVRTLCESAQASRRTNILQAPKVTLFNGQQASILDVTQTPFLVGLRETLASAREPKIAIVQEGTQITLRASHTGDRARVRLNARITLSKIGDVRTVSTSLGSGADPISIPRVKRCRIDVAGEIDDGQSLLVGCVPSYDEQQLFYVLLTARTIRD